MLLFTRPLRCLPIITICFLLGATLGHSEENILIFNAEGDLLSSFSHGDVSVSITKNGAAYQVLSLSFPGGPTASPQDSVFTIPVPDGTEFILPNLLNGSYPAQGGVQADTSIHSFAAPIQDIDNPGLPGLHFSPGAGVYTQTTAVHVEATQGATLDYYFNGDSGWNVTQDSSLELFIHASTVLHLRAHNGNGYSQDYTLAYTINHDDGDHPEMVDSDKDGIPDGWEIAHGMNPLAVDLNSDRDNDGWPDFVEVLRGSDPNDINSKPADQDDDGWSDFDEQLRNTDANNPDEFPVARRLLEPERIISGKFTQTDGSDLLPVEFWVLDLSGQVFATGDTADGHYGPLRLPGGSASLMRGDGGVDARYVLKRYLPILADAKLDDLEDWCTNNGVNYDWTSPAGWQALLEQMLGDVLVVTSTGFDVNEEYTPAISLLERQLALLNKQAPAVHYLFGTSGQAPPPESTTRLLDHLSRQQRNLNQHMTDLEQLIMQDFILECLSLKQQTTAIFEAYNGGDDNLESEIAAMFASDGPRYLAALMLSLSYQNLTDLHNNEGVPWCEMLAYDVDLDSDTVSNLNEITAGTVIIQEDTDEDGLSDGEDNCPTVPNPTQIDFDQDGIGDVCDPDDDNDGLDDAVELAIGSNPYETDTDHDGSSDFEEWEANSDPGILVTIVPHHIQVNSQSVLVTGVRFINATVALNSNIGSDIVGTMTYPTDTTWSCLVSDLVAQHGIHGLAAQASKDSRHGYASGVIDVLLFPGDLDGDSSISLTDAIIGLQVLTGSTNHPPFLTHGDVNGDGAVGGAEVIFILRNVSGGL